ncbi:MAG: gamma-glutamyltransferase family protein [Desulfobacteraceae bacterium]|nr:gamma-glutamyltransferase family protein [Desulfobacteraceae bacterium]
MAPSSSFWRFPYPSQRMPILAENMVATSQPLAAQAGLRMLAAGGNAVDAALAAAVALTVVEPTSNGLGSDAFAIIWDGGQLHGINGSGRSPRAWTLERFAGRAQMPRLGWDAVTVPGAVDLWQTLHRRFGRLPFGDLFTPAIGYARNGFSVSPLTAARWAASADSYADFDEFRRVFLPGGRAPRPGQWFANPDQAGTLEAIAEGGAEVFYRGALARRIAAAARTDGGLMTEADLAAHQSDWVTPLSIDYRGRTIHELPPNGQGLAALVALGVLRHLDLAALAPDSADSLHLQIEAMKVGFAVAHSQVADPRAMTTRPEAWIDDAFLAAQAAAIRMDRAATFDIDQWIDHGTVYLTAADAGGMMVSMIQSNFTGFGSGVVVPGTGIHLQNRGFGFSTRAGHPNVVAGGKRPYHTIIPGFITHEMQPVASLGVMGGHMQPQGHVQMVVRLADYGQNPQAAIDAPRWQVGEDGGVFLEAGVDSRLRELLAARGHRIHEEQPIWGYGGAQMAWCLERGYLGASDPRKDGQAVGF